MATKYLIGIDVGTASIKTAVIDEEANLIGMCAQEYTLDYPEANFIQINSKSLWDSFLKSLKDLLEKTKIDQNKISGIGISCLCPGLTGFDKEGNVIVEPIIYSDRRSIKEAEFVNTVVGKDKLFEITGNNVMAGAMSSTSILWVKNNKPEIYEKIHCFGHVNTLMAQKMTGEYAIDYSNASYTALFETGGGYKWSQELCNKVGIDKKLLPPLKLSTDVIGCLINKDIIAIGIPAGIPVVIGGGDTACASLAAGVVQNHDVCESAGTTNVLTICVDKPKFKRNFLNRCHVVEGTWIYQGAMSYTGYAMAWFRNEFCDYYKRMQEDGGDNAFDLMGKAAERSAPGAGGIVFLPYMMGERSPIWDSYARSVFWGISSHSKRKDMIRSIMEACGYGLRQLIELAEETTGATFSEFISLGGGAKSEIWTQIKADITGKNIKVLDMQDLAPVGAALLAGVGVGVGIYADAIEASQKVKKKIHKKIYSSATHQKVYNDRFMVYTTLYPRIKDLYRIGRL